MEALCAAVCGKLVEGHTAQRREDAVTHKERFRLHKHGQFAQESSNFSNERHARYSILPHSKQVSCSQVPGVGTVLHDP